MSKLETKLSQQQAVKLAHAFESELGLKTQVVDYSTRPEDKPNAMFKSPKEGFAVEWKSPDTREPKVVAKREAQLDQEFKDALTNVRIEVAWEPGNEQLAKALQTRPGKEREALIEGVMRSIADPAQLEAHAQYLEKMRLELPQEEKLDDATMKKVLKDGVAGLSDDELVRISFSTDRLRQVWLAMMDDINWGAFLLQSVDFAATEAARANGDMGMSANLMVEAMIDRSEGEIFDEAISDDDDDAEEKDKRKAAKRRQPHRSKLAVVSEVLQGKMTDIFDRIVGREPLSGELRRGQTDKGQEMEAPDLSF